MSRNLFIMRFASTLELIALQSTHAGNQLTRLAILQTALKTLMVVHRLMRESNISLVEEVKTVD